MENNEQLLKYNENIGLYDHINPVLNLKDLNRKQVKELAKEIANNKSQTHSWQEVSNDAVNYDSKNKRQEKRFKRIFNKQLNENLAPILEKQHKQELIDRMKSGDASAMSQWTTEGIDKFGHQFMPVMLTAATLPFGIGAFGQAANAIGLLPALGAEAGSWGLGYGGYKLGSKLDDDFGTNWIAPALSVASGIGGYGAGYKGMVKLGSKGWLPKGDKFMYGSQFVGDVAADGLKQGIRTTPKVPTIDRTVGIQNRVFTGDPIFPKTTWQIPASNTNNAYRLTGQSQIDDIMQTGFVRPRLGKIKGGHINEVHWSNGHPKSGYNVQDGQYVLETNSNLVNNTSNAISVNDLLHVWTTRNGRVVDVIDEIRPHMRTVSEQPSFKIQSSISGQPIGEELVTPLDAIDAIKRGRRMAGSFFKHPIVKESYAHNQALAKRLGIELPDRPADISEMVTRPVKVGWNTSDNEIANIAQGYYGDPDVTMNFQWKLRPKSDWEAAARHESMHLGYYSAPIRPKTVTQEYYNTISKPSYNFWKWKTDKLLRPEYRDGYLGDVWGGEAGPNLIDIGRELGVKLGQKYPGDTEFLNMMNNYKGLKSNFVPHLQLDTRAGRRHVWDAMTGKYFAIPAVGIGLGLIANNKDEENPQQ